MTYVSPIKRLEPLIILLFLSFGATFGVVCSAYYMGTPIDLVLTITACCITFYTYTINRYTDKEDSFNKHSSASFFDRHNWLLWFSIIILALSVLWLFLLHMITWYHIAVIIIGTAYSVKMLPAINKGKLCLLRLKDICIAKSVIVAIVWATFFFMINWCVFPHMVQNKTNIILLMINFSLATLTATIFTDIRDVEGDKKAGVPTIPVIFGIKNTFVFFIILPSAAFLLIGLYFSLVGKISIPLLLFFAFNLVYPALYIQLYYSGKCPKNLLEPLVDTCFLFFGAGLVLLKCID